MPFSRRGVLLSASALALAAGVRGAVAQAEWKPSRDVEFVIPFAVGGGADLMARVLHKIITEERLVPVSVALVNRPGGGGAVGIGYVSASRKADPHTLVMVNGTTQIADPQPKRTHPERGAPGHERHAGRFPVVRPQRLALEDRG